MKKLNVNLKIKYDKSKPDGMPKKLLNINLAKSYGFGFQSMILMKLLKVRLKIF